MKEPEYILKNGTKVRIHDTLESTAGFMIAVDFMNRRKPATKGIICGIVGGHGGDVYFVGHGEAKEGHFQREQVAVYGWMEFELVGEQPPTVWEHLDEED